MNTVPTSSGCLLLIDSRVTDYQDIINATQSGVQHLVFHVEDIFHVEDMNTEANPFEYIQTRISELGVSAYTNVGLIQHNMRLPVYSMFGSGSGSGSGSFDATITDVETVDPTLQTWAGVSGFITHLKNTYGVQNFDMMACALYSDPDWKYVIDTLAVQTGVTVRASTDDTGAAALGGDWFLESHTGVNLKDVYFTEAIEDFRGVLIYSTKYDSRSYFSTKSMAVGKAVAWGATNYGGGTDVNTITGGVITSGVVALYSTGNAFAALKTNGSVSTWGANGGNQTVGGTSPSVASSLTSGVVEIYTNEHALAALKSDGTVITWGFGSYGGSSTSVDLTNVVDIFSGKYAFAALKSNGSLVTWPSSSIYGGNSSTAASGLTSGVVSVNMAINGEVAAAAALKSDGSVVTWPTTSPIGGNSSAVTSSISSGVVVVYNDIHHTFAALKNNGSVIIWGNTTYSLNGNPYVAATSVTLSNIVTINNDEGAYAALNINGGVVTWGLNHTGGDSSGKSLSSNVVKVYNSLYAFAALKFDGSVVTWGGYTGGSAWGGNSTSVASDLSSGVVAIYGNYYAFAALKSNGKVITWGDSASGGSSSSVATDISAGIVAIYTTVTAFAALRNDGKLITWGDSTPGGNSSSVSTDLSAGVVSVNNTNSAFAAITSTATTFDLSMSYYRDIDRYNILRNKENRRRVNLTTLNNNVFTLSSARDIQKFNYTIPSGNSFRIIVPDYVSSNYSIISTATLPSPAAANYIIACDEGEPVTISGVTYINYGAFVYRRNVADNTFTKMTSAVIDGVTYKLYGGDGLFSSGIALQYRFGAFAIAANFGDASFNITAPVTDSSGAFTYTSSDTTVATVTTGGTVTIIKIGSTTITATQAANGSFTSDSITASLVVGKADSTLGALTVPAKVISDAPFTLTAPTSSNSSIVSPVNTITSTASVIVPPPDIRDISYGTAWAQMGLDILGTQAEEYSGYSVSISADGTVIAIGSYYYDKAGGTTNTGTTEGRTRVYKYNGTAWTQLGLDISGTQAQEYSGVSVSLSADGTIVAIGSRYYDITGTNEVGRTRIYKYNGSSWGQLGLDISGTQAQEYSGVSVSLSADGTTVAIGSWYYDTAGGTTNANTDEGRTRIYKYNGSSWGQLGLDISGTQVGETSGYSVSLSADGTTVAIGSHLGSVSHRGRTRVYKYNGSAWGQLGLDISGTQVSEYSGWSVSLSADGTTVAIGSYFYDKAGGTTDTGTSEGRTRVYKYNGTAWGQLGLDISGTQAQEYSGISVSLSEDGTIVAIGSHAYDKAGGITDTSTGEGRTRVYKYNGTSWTQLGLDVLGTQAVEGSGYSVSLSADGTTVAIGSHGYDKAGGTTNANTDEGRTRIYKIATTNALTYSSSSSSIADVCGNLLLIKGVNGTSTITASQTGNTVTGRLDVSGTTYTLQYNPITYTIDSSSVATVSTYGTVTLTGVGTSTITATQPETLSYASRSVTGSLVVSLITPTIGTLTAPAKNFGDASFNLTAPTSDSSGAFTYTSSNTAVATVTSGGTVTVVGVGSTTITATQAATTNYTGGSVTASLVVSAIAPTIGALTAPAKNFGDASFNLTAPTSDSGGAFTYTSSNTAVATVTSGGTVTVVGVGSTTITATQAATTNYSGGSVTASLVVSASLSNFSVPENKYYGDASFNLVDPDTTDNTVGFTFASSNTSVATLSGTGGRTVTIVGAGSTTITATQAATANRGELNISATLVVHPATPVITLAPITKSYGNSSFRLSPSSTNTDTTGGSVFTFSSDNISVVSFLDASLVRINGIGTATIAITQAASANFTDASSSVVITVNKGASGFSASTFAVAANKTFGDAAFAITTVPIGSSTGAITYASSDEAVAVITSSGSGNAITLVGQGTATFTASQEASALYTADTKTSNTLTVARKTAALTRDTPSTDTITKYYGNAAFTVIATNESNGAFSFTSSDPSFATIDASTGEVSIVAVGSTTLTATRAQTAQYNASSVSWTLNIARGTTTLTGLTSMTRNVTVAPFTVSATSASNGAVSYALQDLSSTVLTIHPTSGLVRLLAPGSAVIVASQLQGTLYEAPSSITATITVSEAGNILEGTTLTTSINYANVDLSGASLANVTITNTNFSSGRLNNTNFNGASINSSNMTSTDLSGATMRNATITGTDFTSANLRRTDLSGANVRSSIFNSAELSGSTLIRLDASGASFINANLTGANLSNADFTNANMTNANIDGADITNVTFTTPQKLQLLKNRGNRVRSEIQVSQVLGSVLLPILSAGSTVRDVPNVANATFKVMIPSTSLVASDSIVDIELDITNFTYFYFPIGENEYFKIQGVKYYISGSTIINYATGASVENTNYGVKAIRLLAGSLTIIVNAQNTLSASSFVVPSPKINTDAPFSPTTLPTSNSSAPIVYSSSNTNIATIHSSTGVITIVEGSSGFVRFTASQVATQTHESSSIMSNELLVNRLIDFTLVGLNQTFSLSTLATLDASSISLESTDATAVFYVRLSDMTNLFQYQTDSFDVNNVDASDIKYYMFQRSTPTEFRINPSHAMMNKTESAGMLGSGVQDIGADKSLVKHDFIRYIALRLFNTHYAVDLFQNEQELHENLTYLGETIRHNIDTIVSGISTTSASETMAYDASGNKYLTNDVSGNTNLCRELMRQIAASEPSRFYNHGGNTAGLRNMPLQENDSINFKLTITAAAGQNVLTGVSVIPSRSYMIKMVLKNTVNTSSNDTNTAVTDSEMYPNSYPYSTSVTTYAPTAESSSGVYNVYSPPAPIPTSRFGFNGWYYANTTTWMNVAPAVRDRVKWVLPPNAAGSSTVADLRYVRMNLKVFNTTSLPFLVVYTQAGSYRKYTISAPNSLANGTVYSFYVNFNSYAREPATVGATIAALTYSNVGTGSFANGEVITSIAIESDNTAAAGTVEFTLSSVVVGEASSEKEYGLSAAV